MQLSTAAAAGQVSTTRAPTAYRPARSTLSAGQVSRGAWRLKRGWGLQRCVVGRQEVISTGSASGFPFGRL